MHTLMNGNPVGLATDASFNMRYAEMSSDLSAAEELQWDSGHLDDAELVHRWTANNDARNYVVLGDPAARLPLAHETGGTPRGRRISARSRLPPRLRLPRPGSWPLGRAFRSWALPTRPRLRLRDLLTRRRWKAPFRGVRLR